MTNYVEVTIDDSEFREWALITKSNFPVMVNTMQNLAELIDLNTRPLTPVETERLRRSYKYVITEQSSDFIEVEVGYDANDPKTGWMYAEYQHETTGLHHPRGGGAFYLTRGIKKSIADGFELIEKDYLTLFRGKPL